MGYVVFQNSIYIDNMLKENLHEGYRRCIKTRYLKEGNLDKFAEHEILKLLLSLLMSQVRYK